MATIRWCPIFPKWDIYQPLRYIMKNNNSPKKVTQLRWGWKVRAVTSQGQRNRRPPPCNCAVLSFCTSIIVSLCFFKRQTSFDKFWRTTFEPSEKTQRSITFLSRNPQKILWNLHTVTSCVSFIEHIRFPFGCRILCCLHGVFGIVARPHRTLDPGMIEKISSQDRKLTSY